MDVKRYVDFDGEGGGTAEARFGERGQYVTVADFDRILAERGALHQRLNSVEEENDRLRAQLAEKDALAARLNKEADGLARKLAEAHALLAECRENIRQGLYEDDPAWVELSLKIDALSASAGPSTPVERPAISMAQVLIAYDYANSHPHKYLRGTTNWCAAVAHSLNEQASSALERKP